MSLSLINDIGKLRSKRRMCFWMVTVGMFILVLTLLFTKVYKKPAEHI